MADRKKARESEGFYSRVTGEKDMQRADKILRSMEHGIRPVTSEGLNRVRKILQRQKRRQSRLFLASCILAVLLILVLLVSLVGSVVRRTSGGSAGKASANTPGTGTESVGTFSSSSSVTPTPTAGAEPTSVLMSFVGDCILGTDENFTYDTSFNAAYDKNGAAWFFKNVSDTFAADDLTCINLTGIYELDDHLDCEDQIKTNIQSLKDKGADIVVCAFHWGVELSDTPDENQVTLAHFAIDNGADLVIGHHPHIIQGIESYKGKYIAYSLGNFCFGGNTSPTETDTIIFQADVTLDAGRNVTGTSIKAIPCSITSDSSTNNYQPQLLTGDSAQTTLQKLVTRSGQILTTEYYMEGVDLSQEELYDGTDGTMTPAETVLARQNGTDTSGTGTTGTNTGGAGTDTSGNTSGTAGTGTDG